MGDIGKAIGYGPMATGEEDEGDMSDMEESPKSVAEPKKSDGGSAEVMAMKMFEKASSPEAKVSALKAFLEACGAIGSDY